MHLRSIRLRGFKSFAEPAELHFEPGVAVIVGPNGSGKSNVAEALQWAMASQPPGEMRAQVAADVLFDGSARRQAAVLCEVELVLDNASGRFGTGRPEISVMRRLRRDGEASYLLNRVAVRRLDVQEALADAGLGRELHAIVNQGRIDEILLSRPSDRRGYIEEAAGLGKYKRRRHRAMLKLHRTDQNLIRARDLENDLKTRLRPLALQASAAERAEALAGEIDAARIEVLSSRIASGRRARARIAAELQTCRSGAGALDEAIAASDAERRALEEEVSGLLSAQEQAAGRFYALATGLDRLVARRESLAERLATLADSRRRFLARAERLEGDAATAATAATEAGADVERLSGTLAAMGDGADDPELERLTAEVASALGVSLAARQDLAELDGRTARAERDGRESAEQAGAAERRAAAAEEEVGRLTAERDASDAAAAVADGAALQAAAVLERARAAAGAASADVAAAREADGAARAEHAAALVAAKAADTRLSGATRAAERGDGLAPAVRRLRDRGVSLALDLVDAPPELEVAVAAAVAWRAGEAVATDAAEAVALLADDELSGAALLCLDRLPARTTPSVGVPLASLVKLRPGAPSGLLEGVVVVDDAAQLPTLSAGVAVMRDGRGFDGDRGMAFRAASGGAVVLELRRELDAARAEAAEAAAALATTGRAAGEAAAAFAAAERADAVGRETVVEAARAFEEASRLGREAARAAESAALRVERAGERLAVAREEQGRLRERSAAAVAEAVELGVRRAELVERAAVLEREHGELDRRRRDVAERVARERAERAAGLERVERRRADRARHAEAADTAARRAEANRSRVVTLDGLMAMVPAVVELLGAAARCVEAIRGPEQERLRELEARAGELSQRMTDVSGRAHELQRQAREAAAATTTLEVEAAHAEEQLGDLVRRRAEVLARRSVEAVERIEPLPTEDEVALDARIERLERRLEQLGAVNPLARQEYEEARQRHEETAEQIADLEASIRELRRLVRDLTATITERFDATFHEVERHFTDTITTLFPGGRGRLRLVDADVPDADAADVDAAADAPPEPAEPGVELEISPAGKQISRLQMLSGGEKALGAIAFLFAIMLARPCPFYVLDEVDAALDDINVDRFLQLVDRYRGHAQFIVITHQKRTMEAADVLYGVTMAGDGISKVVSRRLPAAHREPADLVAT